MQTNDVILSVIIPTKNRYYYLKYLLEYVVEIECGMELEIIVQDNSDEVDSQKEFEIWLKDLTNINIIYEYIKEPLSVIENSDRAVMKARGKYVMFIGDDDIFSKYVFHLIDTMDEFAIDAAFPLNSSYSWPNVKSRLYGDKLAGKYLTTAHTGKVEVLSAQVQLNKLLKVGGTDILNLPRVYHGIVRLDVLKRIYTITGSYFPGPSPDIANAVAVCSLVDNYIVVDVPYIVSGHSRQSTGGQGAEGKHFGEIKDIKHLPLDTVDNWNPEVPFYWSGYTIYSESVLQSLFRMKQGKLLDKFNFSYLYATCLVFDTSFTDRVWTSIRKYLKSTKSLFLLNILFLYVKVWFLRISFHLNHNLKYLFSGTDNKNVKYFENILDVARYNDKIILDKIKKNDRI